MKCPKCHTDGLFFEEAESHQVGCDIWRCYICGGRLFETPHVNQTDDEGPLRIFRENEYRGKQRIRIRVTLEEANHKIIESKCLTLYDISFPRILILIEETLSQEEKKTLT